MVCAQARRVLRPPPGIAFVRREWEGRARGMPPRARSRFFERFSSPNDAGCDLPMSDSSSGKEEVSRNAALDRLHPPARAIPFDSVEEP